MTTLFTPLKRDYCLYYYAFSIFFYVLFVIAVALSIYTLATNKFNFTNLFLIVVNCFTYFLAYFVSRLSYSMCVGSLSQSGAHLTLY